MRYFLATIFILAAAAGLWLFFGLGPGSAGKRSAAVQARIVSPKNDNSRTGETDSDKAERQAAEDLASVKISLSSGESAIAVAAQDFDGDSREEQVVAVKRTAEADSPVRLVFAVYDQTNGNYRRAWEASSGATKPRTFTLAIKDLVGDKGQCIVAQGMNASGEQTLTVYRSRPSADTKKEPFEKIADLRTDGAVSLVEKDKEKGGGFRIAAYGRDFDSANILDQIETTYDFDAASGKFERSGVARIAGAQIEQRRLRQLLDGTPERFERFLDGLWQLSGDDAAAQGKQYVLFDPLRREVIFYSDDIQEVFVWQNSSATRYGLYLTTQNISVTTLRRVVDVELQAADAISVRVYEDVKLKVGGNDRWDGSYRKAGRNAPPIAKAGKPGGRLDAEYRASGGTLRFRADGRYEFASDAEQKQGPDSGVYAFFNLEGSDFLELRKETAGGAVQDRAVYKIERPVSKDAPGDETLKLTRVRLTVNGAQDMHEQELSFKRVKTAGKTQSPNP